MKWVTGLIAVCTTIFSSMQGEEFPIQEVLEMAKKDTEVREKWISHRDLGEVRAQEIQNTIRLKEILARYGIPTEKEITDEEDFDDLVEAIQRLVLRSSDLCFQKQVLETMPSLCNDAIDILTDRILLRQGLPQRYGTHLYHESDRFVPYPIEDLEKADVLRKELEEPLFTDYLTMVREMDQAIRDANDSNLYRVIFNATYDFHKNPSDYLYSASFDPQNTSSQENWEQIAFETPDAAIAFAMYKYNPAVCKSYEYTRSPKWEGEHLLVSLSLHNDEATTFLLNTPLYVSIVPCNHAEEETEASLPIVVSAQRDEPVQIISCDNVLEALLMSGCRLKFRGPDFTDWEYKDTYCRNRMLHMMLFDITMENEGF